MKEEDRLYFKRRIEEERQLALNSDDNSTALAHSRMADAYEQRLKELSPAID